MLDAYIIDAVRREEEERERDFARRRVRLELPIGRPGPERPRYPEPAEREDGPVVIPLDPPPEVDAA